MSERIASATTERGEVTLRRVEDACGRDALELRVGGAFVMDTAITSTERRLASAALQRCASPQRVLVGGLGLGFTTAEVLTDERVQQVQVVEIEQPVIDWLGQGMVPGGPELLADPRLEVVCADVLDHIAAAPQRSVDLVLMDVDNGPGQLVHAGNAGLYQQVMLHRLRRMLRPGGAVMFWSAEASPELRASMAEVFEMTSEEALPVQLQERSENYWLYTALADARGGSSRARGK
ncbi:MAG TPA: hypothetical protein VK086_03995 [Ruania sp.]|nr:hypothetical protein [Ruania sp.]